MFWIGFSVGGLAVVVIYWVALDIILRHQAHKISNAVMGRIRQGKIEEV